MNLLNPRVAGLAVRRFEGRCVALGEASTLDLCTGIVAY